MIPRLSPVFLLVGCWHFDLDTGKDASTDDTAIDSDTDTDTDTDSDTDTDTVDTDTDDDSNLVVEITTPSPTQPFDECGEVCFAATVRWISGGAAAGAEVDFEVENYGYLASALVADDNGQVSFCAPAPPTGVWSYTVSAQYGDYLEDRVRDTSSFTVVPFGYDAGFDRSDEILAEVPWEPDFVRYAGNPIMMPGTDPKTDFDYKGPFVPTVVKDGRDYWMWYAGQQVDNGQYVNGFAASTDGLTWEKWGMNPDVSYPTGDVGVGWKATSTNSPMLLLKDGVWMLYYTGKREDTSDLNVGLATSAQYEDEYGTAGSAWNVADLPTTDEGGVNPVLVHIDEEETWGGDAVAHPSVIWNEDQGFFEMWYSTGLHRVGYALSQDGITWDHYCRNPILTGEGSADDDGNMNWEMGRVKSTEIAYYSGYYMMTYTGGNTGDFQLGWAMSKDGIHWTKSEEPVLGPDTESVYENQALQGGFLVPDGDVLRMWYGASFSGGGVNGTTLNYAESDLPATLP